MITVFAGMFQIIRGAGGKYKAELKTIQKKKKKKGASTRILRPILSISSEIVFQKQQINK